MQFVIQLGEDHDYMQRYPRDPEPPAVYVVCGDMFTQFTERLDVATHFSSRENAVAAAEARFGMISPNERTWLTVTSSEIPEKVDYFTSVTDGLTKAHQAWLAAQTSSHAALVRSILEPTDERLTEWQNAALEEKKAEKVYSGLLTSFYKNIGALRDKINSEFPTITATMLRAR